VRGVVVTIPAPDALEQAPVVETAVPAPSGPAPLQGPELAAALQTELNRLGCGAGTVDGQWGRGSRAAFDRLLAALGQPPSDGADPTAPMLAMLKGLSDNLCTSQCAAGVTAACVAAAPESCPPGQRLSSKGTCYVPTQKSEPARTKPRAPAPSSGGKCTVFNGRRIC
jgi:hypothetical protein